MPPEMAIATNLATPETLHTALTAAVEQAVVGLTRVWSDARLYPPTHPVIAERLQDTEAKLAGAMADGAELTIKHLDGDLVHGAHRLFQNRPRPAGFMGALDRLGIGCITFLPGVTPRELGEFCRTLAEDSEGQESASALGRQLTEKGVTHVQVDRLAVLRAGSVGGGARVPVAQLYNSAVDVARRVMQSARLGTHIDVEGAQTVTDRMIGEITVDPSTALGLASLRGHDEYSFTHCVHTALLSLVLGDYIGLNESELRQLGMAALLHDVGKSAIPIDVLRKPGKLTDPEWSLMTRHPSDGACMLLDYDRLPAVVPVVAFEHHIHCDRTGYPELRRPRDLTLMSLVVSLADVYDALTTHRPYRPPLSPDVAVAEIAGMSGRHLDGRLVGWFRAMLGAYPPGTCVALNTGECAVVCATNHDDPERPLVTVVTDPQGALLATPVDVDLRQATHGRHTRAIRGAAEPAQVGVDPSSVMGEWLARQRNPAGA